MKRYKEAKKFFEKAFDDESEVDVRSIQFGDGVPGVESERLRARAVCDSEARGAEAIDTVVRPLVQR